MDHVATALVTGKRSRAFAEGAFRMSVVATLVRNVAATAALLLLPWSPAHAASNKVRITNLSDIAFGTIANLNVDAVRNENVCVYSDTNTNGYNVTATGSGPSGSFRLASGINAMAYEVQWSSSTGQSSGIQLAPNVPLTGQVSSATHQTCSTGPATSASLVIILRSAALSSAAAGTYNGALTLLVGPE